MVCVVRGKFPLSPSSFAPVRVVRGKILLHSFYSHGSAAGSQAFFQVCCLALMHTNSVIPLQFKIYIKFQLMICQK